VSSVLSDLTYSSSRLEWEHIVGDTLFGAKMVPLIGLRASSASGLLAIPTTLEY
jgi:hypothetical protein